MAGQKQLYVVKYTGMAMGVFKWGMGIKNFFQQSADKAEATRTGDFQKNLTTKFLEANPAMANNLSGGLSTVIAEEAKHMAKNNGATSSLSDVLNNYAKATGQDTPEQGSPTPEGNGPKPSYSTFG